MDRSDFFGTVYPAESSGLNVHRLRAMLNSEHFVADCAATPQGPQNGQRPPVSSTTEAGALGAQSGAQPLHDLSDALSEVVEIEQWWNVPHCESTHRPGTPNCSHVPVARFSCGCEPGRGSVRVCANVAEYARSCIAGYQVCKCGELCRDCWRIDQL